MRFAPTTYFQAREGFREKAQRKGLKLESILLPFSGPMGEELTIDIAYAEPALAKSALIHVSGTHGVEGFAGSAIQQQILENLDLRSHTSTSLFFIHTINPYGMSWLRRVNANNIDLNRNYFQDEKRPQNRYYKYFGPLLNPATQAQLMTGLVQGVAARVSFGKEVSLQAIAQGQYEFPKGLFYGGVEVQPELQLLHKQLKVLLRGYERIFVMDIHTGLGKFDQELLIGTDGNAHAEIRLMNEAFGRTIDGHDASVGIYSVHGELDGFYRAAAPQARLGYVVQEFGTIGAPRMINALRLENYDYHYGDGQKSAVTKAKLALKEAFFPENGLWRNRVLKQGVTRFRQLALMI